MNEYFTKCPKCGHETEKYNGEETYLLICKCGWTWKPVRSTKQNKEKEKPK